MKLLIEISKLSDYKSRSLIPLECKYCKSIFYRPKNRILAVLKNSGKSDFSMDYCSIKCFGMIRSKQENIPCHLCKKITQHKQRTIKKSKHLFCSSSCAAKYNNAHKTTGCRRSKLEKWIEKQLTIKYPNLHIDYNKTDAINAELDIYIPSLRLAFELNGIFHYEPIYGNVQLEKIKTNDHRKFSACSEKKIELCIIDVSSQKYFKENTSEKYLNIITNILSKKVGK